MSRSLLRAVGVVATAAALATPSLRAQADYEIEVYPSATVLPHFVTVELHSNYTLEGQSLTPITGTGPIFSQRVRESLLQDPTCHDSSTPYADVTPLRRIDGRLTAKSTPLSAADSVGCTAAIPLSTQHTAHELAEFTAGLTGWSEVAVYGFAIRPPGSTLQVAGGSARIKVRIPDAWRWPVGVALSTEIEHERSTFSAHTWSWEIRPIIDRASGRWYVAINPTVERVLAGTDTSGGLQFSPSARITYDVARVVTTGIEYYGAFGRFGAFASPNNQLQQVFGAADLRLWPAWEINAGLGVGATGATSHLVAKIIIERRFSW